MNGMFQASSASFAGKLGRRQDVFVYRKDCNLFILRECTKLHWSWSLVAFVT
jgi:hypothetical protein